MGLRDRLHDSQAQTKAAVAAARLSRAAEPLEDPAHVGR